MNRLTRIGLNSTDLGSISIKDIQSGTNISLEELGQRVFEDNQNRFSSIEINQQQNLQDFRDRLFELTQDEYDDEFLAPTNFAYQTIVKFLRGLSESFDRLLPIPNFVPDGEGGIRAEWKICGRILSLVCPAKSDWKPYIYFEEGDFYDVNKDVKLGTFIKRFSWLIGL